MADSVDFQPYLESLLPDPANQDWGDRYTPIQVELPLKVQTIVQENLGDPITQRRSEAQKPERFEVLEGLREALQENDRVLLVGKPGSGKSTALRRLLWEEAQTALEMVRSGQDDCRISVLIELRGCSDGSVVEGIQRALRRLRLSQEAIEDLLFDGWLLLLLDGLNELPSSVAWTALDEFRRDKDFHNTPIIVTTRELGAGADLGIKKKLEMVPLTEPQMRDFIQKRLPGQADSLLRQLKDRLRELAETPLLLQMLCDVVAESKDGQIPQNRGELFRQEFARRYEAFKPLRGRVSEDSRRFTPELLQHLAFVMTQGDPHTDPLKPTPSWLTIPKAQAEAILETYLTDRVEAPAKAAKEWLEDLLEFHLLQIANEPEQIEFHHQLFQEYYAAEALLQKLPKLSDTEIKRHYLNYLKWTEAISLMIGLLEMTTQATRVLELASEVDLVLEGKLIDSFFELLQERSLSWIENRQISEHLKVYLLGLTHSDLAIQHIQKRLQDDEPSVREAALAALYQIYSEATVPALRQALADPDADLGGQAASMLGEIARELKSSSAISVLCEAVNHKNTYIRNCVVSALGFTYHDAAIPALKKAYLTLKGVDSYPEWEVRRSVMNALAYIPSEAVLPVIVEALTDNRLQVCLAAIEVLGYIGSGRVGSKAAVSQLINILIHNQDSTMRSAAASYLGATGDKVSLPYLKKALLDDDPSVRYSASFALRNFKEIPPEIRRLSPFEQTEWHLEQVSKYIQQKQPQSTPKSENIDKSVLLDALKSKNKW